MTPMLELQQVAPSMPSALLVGDGDVQVLRVHTDTRSVEPGDLFFALKGEKFDANDFLHEAQQRGAVAVVCHRGLNAAKLPSGLPRIEVDNTTLALGAFATAWRRIFSLPLIAVTGSNGKTTVTQMIAAILDASRPDGRSLATRGNLNNDIGVPLTLLRMRAEHEVAVVELGMNHAGEIAALAHMAQPTVALVNNAQREHLEFMQTVQTVAQENGAVIDALGPHGVAVFPADDHFASLWSSLAGSRRSVSFDLAPANGVDLLGCLESRWESGHWHVKAQGLGVDLSYRLAIAGKHNVKNSLAAAACALSAGVPAADVVRGLESFEPVKGRSRALALAVRGHDVTLVDDTYNANPDSVSAAIDVLADLPGPHLLVLGDMGEVGHQGPLFHSEAGHYAQARGIRHLLLLGEASKAAAEAFEGAFHYASMDELIPAVLAALPRISSILVKGSRFMRMERVVAAALDAYPVQQESIHAS